MNIKQVLSALKSTIPALTFDDLKAWCESNDVDTNGISDADLERIKAAFAKGLATKGQATNVVKVKAGNTAHLIDTGVSNQEDELTQLTRMYIDGKSTNAAAKLREITSEFAPQTLAKLGAMIEEDGQNPEFFRSEARTAFESFGFPA